MYRNTVEQSGEVKHTGVVRLHALSSPFLSDNSLLTGGGLYDPAGQNRGALILQSAAGPGRNGGSKGMRLGVDLSRAAQIRTDSASVVTEAAKIFLNQKPKGYFFHESVLSRSMSDDYMPISDLFSILIDQKEWSKRLWSLPLDAFAGSDPEDSERTMLGLVCEYLGERAFSVSQVRTVDQLRSITQEVVVLMIVGSCLAAAGITARERDARSLLAMDKALDKVVKRLRLRSPNNILIDAMTPPPVLAAWRDDVLLKYMVADRAEVNPEAEAPKRRKM